MLLANRKKKLSRFILLLATLILILIIIPRYNNTKMIPGQSFKPSYYNSVNNPSFYPTPNASEIHPPAVLLHLKGGTGNQLFQYASHYALARKHDWPLYVMIRSKIGVKNQTWRSNERHFALDQFHIPLHPWNMAHPNSTVHNVTTISDSMLLQGNYPLDKVLKVGGGDYTQSALFFTEYEEEIRALFSQKIQIADASNLSVWIQKIQAASESVSVHIRRGDYGGAHGILPLSFFRGCMEALTERIKKKRGHPTFFVFSDDIKGVMKNQSELFPRSASVQFVSNLQMFGSLDEFYLMTKCKHHINSHSTFSWWATFLSEPPNGGIRRVVYAAPHRESFMEGIYGKSDEGRAYFWGYTHLFQPANWIQVEGQKQSETD